MQPYKYEPLNTNKSELRLISLLPSTNADDYISFSIFHTPFPYKYNPKAEDQNAKTFLGRVNGGLKLGWTALGVSNGRIVYCNKDKGLIQFEHPGARPALLRRRRHSIRVLGVDAKIPLSVGSDVPQFEALSYVWGSSDNPVTVHVLGDDETQTTATKPCFSLAVGQNLAQALRHLRREDSPRTLWVDAICINQEDPQERAAQVARMGAIYRYAAGVVIWLGPPSETSSQAMRDLTDYGDRYLLTLDGQPIPNPDTYVNGTLMIEPYRPPDDWLPAISDLFARPWFRRLWTYQEGLLGASRAVLHCGSDSMPWALLMQAVYRMCMNQDDGYIWPGWFNREILGMIVMCQVQHLPSNLILVSRLRACTDPRDKVYGVLSLLRPEISERITADYNMPLHQLHRDIFIADLETTSRLDFMLSAGQGNQAPGLPSWVPRWTVDVSCWEPPSSINLSASASGYTDAVWSTHRGSLNVIDFVGTKPLQVTWVSEPVTTLHDLYSLMQRLGGTAMKNENPDALDDFVHFIHGGNFTERIEFPVGRKSLRECRFTALCQLACYEEQGHDGQSSMPHSCRDRIEFYKLHEYMHTCRIIMTEDGFLGQCSVAAKAGDHVAILLGCDVPLLLRPEGITGQGIPPQHKFVGTCYIPGKMDGQAVMGPIPKSWQPLYTHNQGRSHLVFMKDGVSIYSKRDKRVVARHDPRLANISVPKGWKELGPTLMDDLPYYQFDYAHKWKHKKTGRIIRSDPRLLPEELVKRGVELQIYQLI